MPETETNPLIGKSRAEMSDGRFVLEVFPGIQGDQHCDDEYLLEINGLN